MLLSLYKFPKNTIIEKLKYFLHTDIFVIDTELIFKTFELFEGHAISFVDAYVSACVILKRSSSLITFDKKLHKLPDVKAKKPDQNN